MNYVRNIAALKRQNYSETTSVYRVRIEITVQRTYTILPRKHRNKKTCALSELNDKYEEHGERMVRAQYTGALRTQ